jgi:hypothetical protein
MPPSSWHGHLNDAGDREEFLNWLEEIMAVKHSSRILRYYIDHVACGTKGEPNVGKLNDFIKQFPSSRGAGGVSVIKAIPRAHFYNTLIPFLEYKFGLFKREAPIKGKLIFNCEKVDAFLTIMSEYYFFIATQ